MEGLGEALGCLFKALPILLVFSVLGVYELFKIVMWLVHHIKIM